MAYKDLFSKLVEESNLTHKEISDKCKGLGVSISPSYISQLRTGKIPPPSDEITKAIAKVCGGQEDLLLIEAYIEKAPEPIIKFFRNVMNFNTALSLSSFKNKYPEAVYKLYEGANKNQSLSEYILEINKSSEVYEDLFNRLIEDGSLLLDIDQFNNISFNFNQAVKGIEMPDESLEPLIPKGSELIFEPSSEAGSYMNGDIIAVKRNIDNTDYLIIGKFFIRGSEFVLMPINKKFLPEVFSISDLSNIVGKVIKVIIKV